MLLKENYLTKFCMLRSQLLNCRNDNLRLKTTYILTDNIIKTKVHIAVNLFLRELILAAAGLPSLM